ncbi:MAG: hypothetical protein D6B26_01355 [Spirochaetaceae bacterium]|nr:MAG: hypothetical protein D6B26_01355 [Spirochaetaceae bacterium]
MRSLISFGRRSLATLPLLLLLAGCQQLPPPEINILTSEPILFVYAEYFNAHNNSLHVNVRYDDDPIKFLNSPGEAPDIIIQPDPAGTFQTGLFHRIPVTQDRNTYPQLINQFKYFSKETMLPLAFSLPAIVWHGDRPGNDLPLTIGLKQLGELHTGEEIGGQFRYLGFSPTWNKAMPLWYLHASGLQMAFTREGVPAWDSKQLETAAMQLRDWSSEHIGEPGLLQKFDETYLYAPYYALLREDRIGYYPVNLGTHLALPPYLRRELDFAWFGSNGRVPVISILYAAIPKQSKHRKLAAEFLQWLIHPENQQQLMEFTISQELEIFGFFGRLSSSININEQIIPRMHPELTGKAPVASRLIFPPPLPHYWRELEQDVIAPFLQDVILQKVNPDNSNLESRIKLWLSQQESG